MFGACFGHQILCKTILKLGIEKMKLEIGVHPVTLSQIFLDTFDDIITSKPPNPLRIQLVHEDHVVAPVGGRLPLGCIVVGASTDCCIQGVYLTQRLLTFQGHAEFDRHICKYTSEVFFAAELKSDPLFTVECMERIDQDDDGSWAREAIWNFLMQPAFDSY
jgi:GMP synthase-like glutamine amidotransferase